MTYFSHRISRLLWLKEQYETEQSKYEPFCELRIYSIMENTASVIFFPQGIYGSREKTDGLTILSALEKSAGHKTEIFINMLFCDEWAHVFWQTIEGYSREQRERLKADDLEKPSIRKLYEDGESARIMAVLEAIPQINHLHGLEEIYSR